MSNLLTGFLVPKLRLGNARRREALLRVARYATMWCGLCCIANAFGDDLQPLVEKLSNADPLIAKNAHLGMDTLVHKAARPGNEAERATVAADIAKLLDAKQPESIRRDALNWLGYIGGDADVPAIAALLSSSSGIAEDARMTLERIPGAKADDALISAVATVPPSVKPGVMNALCMRNVKRAIPDLTREARNTMDKEVGWAAFDALAGMGVPPNAIFPPPINGTSEELNHYVRGSLRAAAANLAEGNTKRAEALYFAIASGTEVNSDVFAALTGLVDLKSPKAVDLALGYLSDPAKHTIARECLVQAVNDTATDRMTRAMPLLPASVRATVLEILATRRAPNVRELATQAQKDETPDVRIAAAYVLGVSTSVGDLEQVIEHGAPWSRASAADEYFALANEKQKAGDVEASRSMYEAIARAGVSDEMSINAWKAIETIGSPASWPLVEEVAKTYENAAPPAVSNEFVTALKRAYVSVLAAQPDKVDTQAKLLALQSTTKDAAVNALITGKLRGLGYDTEAAPQQHGFITRWKIAGPLASDNNSGYGKSYFDESKIPEAGIIYEGTPYPWKETIVDSDPAVIDLAALISPKQNIAAYAQAQIRCDTAMSVVFLIGSNDGCEFYVNGQRLFGTKESRALTVDQDRVEAKLNSGINTVLIKVLQAGGAWQFCVRMTNADGTPVDMTQHRP